MSNVVLKMVCGLQHIQTAKNYSTPARVLQTSHAVTELSTSAKILRTSLNTLHFKFVHVPNQAKHASQHEQHWRHGRKKSQLATVQHMIHDIAQTMHIAYKAYPVHLSCWLLAQAYPAACSALLECGFAL